MIDPSPTTLPRNVKLLGWASFLNDVASEIIAPLLPQFLIGVLGGTRLHLGIIEGLADSTASVLKLLAGGWSDRSGGRKPLVVLGYALATVSRPFLALAQLPWHLLAVRLSDRIGKGLRTAPRDALIVDSTDERARGRAFGFHRGMDHLGAAVGPLLAAAFLWYWPAQIRLLFALAFLPGVLVVVLLVLGLKEVRMARAEGVRRNWKLGQYPPTFRRYLFAILIFTLGNSSDLFLLLRAQELGVAAWLMPLLWFSFHVVKSAGNMIAGRAVDRFGARRMLVAGWLWYAAVYVGFALVAQAWLAWLLFLLYAVYYGLAEPAEKTIVAEIVGSREKGLAYGWYNLIVGIAAFPASVICGAIYQTWGAIAAFGSGAALACLAAAIVWGVRTR